jgi:hypothetical protein
MMTLSRQSGWFADEEVRFNFCSHRASPLADVMRTLDRLPTRRLNAIAVNGNIRAQIRSRSREVIARRRSG